MLFSKASDCLEENQLFFWTLNVLTSKDSLAEAGLLILCASLVLVET